MDNKFFTKNEENLRATHLEGILRSGGSRQVRRSPPLKPTTALRIPA